MGNNWEVSCVDYCFHRYKSRCVIKWITPMEGNSSFRNWSLTRSTHQVAAFCPLPSKKVGDHPRLSWTRTRKTILRLSPVLDAIFSNWCWNPALRKSSSQISCHDEDSVSLVVGKRTRKIACFISKFTSTTRRAFKPLSNVSESLSRLSQINASSWHGFSKSSNSQAGMWTAGSHVASLGL